MTHVNNNQNASIDNDINKNYSKNNAANCNVKSEIGN